MNGPDLPRDDADPAMQGDDRPTRDRAGSTDAAARLDREVDEAGSSRLRPAVMRTGRRIGGRRWLALGATACLCLVIGIVGGWFARDLVGGPAPLAGRAWAAMAEDALAAHRTFSVEVAHPVEVRAGEEPYLGRWLSKRLDRRLAIPDLEDRFGLRLVGGRILPAGRVVAGLLMYADPAGSRLTVYVRSGERGEPALKFLADGDLASISWVEGGAGYVVSATMVRERLQAVARAIAQEFDLDAAKQRRAL